MNNRSRVIYPAPILVVGYGNPSRKDDGVGLWVASRLSYFYRNCSFVEVRILHQLVPELIEDLCCRRYVVFIDAASKSCFVKDSLEDKKGWFIRGLYPKNEYYFSCGKCTPEHLLFLSDLVYSRLPTRSWIVSVKAEDFSFGSGLTELTRSRAIKVESFLRFFLNKLIDKLKEML